MEFRAWVSPQGEQVQVLAWPDGPEAEIGPMVVAQREAITVGGQSTALITASVWMGDQAEVLVCHLRRAKARYAVVGRGIEVSAFRSVLETVEVGEE